MPETDENRKLQKITRLLEKGGTMLASHHECGAPLFRYQGKVLCPVCDSEERKEVPVARATETRKPEIREPEKRQVRAEKAPEMIEKHEMAESAAGSEGIRREVIPVREPPSVELSKIAALTQNKIHAIAQGLGEETDLQRVKEKLECIELGLRVLKLLGS